MTGQRTGPETDPQRGVALLLLLLLLMGAAGLVLSGFGMQRQAQRDRLALESLAEAKRQLIAYAVAYAENYGPAGAGPGHLPCPDVDNDGRPDTSVCATTVIGRMPTTVPATLRTVNLPEQGRGVDLNPWYAVSPAFRNFPPGPVNDTTAGELRVDGRSDVIAVLVAPGERLVGQSRPSDAVADYLEGENADGDLVFTAVASGGNDIALAIHRSEVMPLVLRRVVEPLVRYRESCGQYPWPAPYADPVDPATPFASAVGASEGLIPVSEALPVPWDSGCASGITVPAWLQQNGWHRTMYYAIASATGDCVTGVNCLTVNGLPAPNNDKGALVVFAGAALAGQDRATPTGLTDYFEAGNGSPGDRVFDAAAPAPFNDSVVLLR